jgi:hypothetical protein
MINYRVGDYVIVDYGIDHEIVKLLNKKGNGIWEAEYQNFMGKSKNEVKEVNFIRKATLSEIKKDKVQLRNLMNAILIESNILFSAKITVCNIICYSCGESSELETSYEEVKSIDISSLAFNLSKDLVKEGWSYEKGKGFKCPGCKGK